MRVLVHEGQLRMVAQYWGLFVSDKGGPWRWICDEAINQYALRAVWQGLDGTLYAADTPGLSVSRDGGCTFYPATGGVAGLAVNSVVADPAPGLAGHGVWLTGTGQGGSSGLYHSGDSGQSFALVRPLLPAEDPTQHLLRGAAVGADGRLHVLVAAGPLQDQARIYTSRDGGQRFAVTAIQPPAGIEPGRSRSVGTDPRDSALVYVHFVGLEADDNVLVQVHTETGAVTELLRVPSYIFDVRWDDRRGQLVIGTGIGLYRLRPGQQAARSTALSRAACLGQDGDRLLVCGEDQDPDQAALAVSLDGGDTAAKLFRFRDTAGVLSCPAGTPVAQICPAVWRANAAQLGADQSGPGSSDGSMPGGCSTTQRGQAPAPSWLLCLVLVGLRLAFWGTARCRRGSDGAARR